MRQSDPVTIVINRNIRAGSEQAFESVVKRFVPGLLACPGHLGVHMLRPAIGDRQYRAVLKFRSWQEWQEFQRSAVYLCFLSAIRPYLDGDPQDETICGLESWFTPIGAQVAQVPPRWKMALVTWIGVCVTVYAVTLLFTPVTGRWPALLNFVTINAGVVVGLTWCVMPILNRFFSAWLLPANETDGAHSERKSPTSKNWRLE